MLDSITIGANLVAANDGRDVVGLAPSASNVWTETDSDSTLRRTTAHLLLRIRPKKLLRQQSPNHA